MSDLTTYRIELRPTWDMDIAALIRNGVLVPDTRLQEIADAWNGLTLKEQTELPTPIYRAIRKGLVNDE